MSSPRLVAAAAFVVITLLTASAAADEPAPADPMPTATVLAPWRILSASSLTTEAGSTLALPAGVVIVTADGWEALDVEVRRLQEAEVRLGAENHSLRASAKAAGPGWGTLVLVVSAFGAGIVAARYAL